MPPFFDQLFEWGPPYVALGFLLWGIWKAAKWLGGILFSPSKDGAGGGLITRYMNKQEQFLDHSMAAQSNILQVLGDQSGAIAQVERRLNEIVATVTDPGECAALVELFLKSIPVPLATVDEGGTYLRANEAFENLLGYTSEELSELNFQEITPDASDLQRDVESANRVIRGEISEYRMEKTYLRKNGSEIYCALYVFRFPAKGAFRFHVSCVLPLSSSHSLR